MPTTELTEEQSMELVQNALVGRIVTTVEDFVSIHPVSHTVIDGAVYFRTVPGDKLAALTINAAVLFEADGITEDSAWSVVIRGYARRVDDDPTAIDGIVPRLRRPYLGGRREAIVRITPESISGRIFVPAGDDEDEFLEPTD